MHKYNNKHQQTHIRNSNNNSNNKQRYEQVIFQDKRLKLDNDRQRQRKKEESHIPMCILVSIKNLAYKNRLVAGCRGEIYS